MTYKGEVAVSVCRPKRACFEGGHTLTIHSQCTFCHSFCLLLITFLYKKSQIGFQSITTGINGTTWPFFLHCTVGHELLYDHSNRFSVLWSVSLQELAVLRSNPTQLCSPKLVEPSPVFSTKRFLVFFPLFSHMRASRHPTTAFN